MKCQELADVVSRIGMIIEAAEGRVAGPNALLRLLQIAPTSTVAKLATTIASLKPLASKAGTEIGVARAFSDAAQVHLEGLAKAAVTKDFAALSGALAPHIGSDFEEFVVAVQVALAGKAAKVPPPVREEVVRRYQNALEQALGDDEGFAAVLGQLRADPEVKVAEVVALAKRFAFASTTTRAAALKKIEARQQSLMTSRAKAAATAGRIAG
jgi:hypothetical protein